MPKQAETLAPYLATVVEDYRKNLAQTGAAMGQAVLWLSLVTTRQERRDGSPRVDLARELREAQTALAMVSDSLLNAANIIDREVDQ